MHYQSVCFDRDAQTGQPLLLERSNPSDSLSACRRFDLDLKQMSSQPIDVSSQQLNEAVSRHPEQAQTQNRTEAQAQALVGLGFDDQVMFARVRDNTPGHVSDEHVMQAMVTAKTGGISDASEIGSVMMLGDQIRVAGSGESGKSVIVDVTQPTPSLQASIEATNTLNQQQAQTLAQTAPNLDNPAPKGAIVLLATWGSRENRSRAAKTRVSRRRVTGMRSAKSSPHPTFGCQ